MKYKDNEINYRKAKKLAKRNNNMSNIDTLYLDHTNYNNDLVKLNNVNNLVIDTSKMPIIDKDKTDKREPNLIYIQDTKAENLYFINEINLGGITYSYTLYDITLRIHFTNYNICKIKEVNIVLQNGKQEKIETEYDTTDINIISNRLETGIIEIMVEIVSNRIHKTYYINEITGLDRIIIHRKEYTKDDIKNGILDLTDLNKNNNIYSKHLNVDTLIINKNDINNSKFRETFNDRLYIKNLKILENNNMKINPIKEIEINDKLIIYKGYLLNGIKNKLIYLDKNNEIKVFDKKELLNNKLVSNVDFMFTNDIKLIIIKYKNNEFKIIDKDLEYNLDSLFNKFLLLNIDKYDFYDKEKQELTNYINNNNYYNIFNDGIIDNNLLNIIYKDYVEFIKYINELKKIGFTDEALYYLIKKKYENIINTKSNNLLEINNISKDEIDMFNKIGEKEIMKKLKK